MIYEELDEILIYCENFDWENTLDNLFHAEDTLTRLKFIDRAVLFLNDQDCDEKADPAILDLLEVIIDYRDLIQEFDDSFVAEEDSPFELFRENEYVREIETELRQHSEIIIERLSDINE